MFLHIARIELLPHQATDKLTAELALSPNYKENPSWKAYSSFQVREKLYICWTACSPETTAGCVVGCYSDFVYRFLSESTQAGDKVPRYTYSHCIHHLYRSAFLLSEYCRNDGE
jgi:hypothetical protein